MKNKFTKISLFRAKAAFHSKFTAAVSLHCHTCYSKEDLGFIPQYATRIPFLSFLYRHEMNRHLRLNGTLPDFNRGYWLPPISPTEVHASETGRIRKRLQMMPLVSVTDHDHIGACLDLQRSCPAEEIPISLEWTLPYGQKTLHIGVHNLPPGKATALADELYAYRQRPCPEHLADLLDRLNQDPQILVVLNHPLCDLVEVGVRRQQQTVVDFLNHHAAKVHALEINGYRSWRENRLVLALAEKYGLPAISGGDRHCFSPNAVLNLTKAKTFPDFVAEIRHEKFSRVLLMHTYLISHVARELEAFGDFFRLSSADTSGSNRWKDRVVYQMENGIEKTLAYYWKTSIPIWLKCLIWVASLSAHKPIKAALRMALPKNEAVAV